MDGGRLGQAAPTKRKGNDMAREIILYAADFCHDCKLMKDFLKSNGIDYEERDIKANPAWSKELMEKTGKEGVPYLVIDGEWVRGYELGVGFTEAHAKSILGQG